MLLLKSGGEAGGVVEMETILKKNLQFCLAMAVFTMHELFFVFFALNTLIFLALYWWMILKINICVNGLIFAQQYAVEFCSFTSCFLPCHYVNFLFLLTCVDTNSW